MREITPEEIDFWDKHNDNKYIKTHVFSDWSTNFYKELEKLKAYVESIKFELGTQLAKVVTLLEILVGIMACIGGGIAVILVNYVFRGIA